jgi:hypothetical protein
MFPSMSPRSWSTTPQVTARYSRRIVRAANCAPRRAFACAVFATTITPLVSLSSR